MQFLVLLVNCCVIYLGLRFTSSGRSEFCSTKKSQIPSPGVFRSRVTSFQFPLYEQKLNYNHREYMDSRSF